MRISAWQRIEFVVNIETGVCEVFVEHADDKRETRIVLDRERDAAMDARNAAAYDLRLVTDELRELQQARFQWETERQRLMSLADNNRNAIMDAIAETLLGKRARTHQHDDDDYTQPPSGGAA